MTEADLTTYYAKRAREYDRVYDKPERQTDLRTVEASLPPFFRDRRVLEVAAGTGYWTQFFADAASTVLATDVNTEVLEVAEARRDWPNVVFQVADAFHLDQLDGSFDAAMVGFFWSHLTHDQLQNFLRRLTTRLEPGSPIMFIDNAYVEGSNHPVTRTDDDGNTFQTRKLADGSTWEVLKNFPTTTQIHEQLDPLLAEVEVVELEYFWQATGHTLAQPAAAG